MNRQLTRKSAMKHHVPCLLIFLVASALPLAAQPQKQWQPIASPTEEEIDYARLLNTNLGYIHTQNNSIFKYENGAWTRIPLPEGPAARNAFFLPPNQVWLVVQFPHTYRSQLVRYLNGRWQYVPTPNVDHILTLAFEDSAHGWAGCEWGEILRYENGHWRQVYCPTRFHVNDIFFGEHENKYAITDNVLTHKQILRWDGQQWRIWISDFNPRFLKGFAFKDDHLWLVGEQLYLAHGDTLWQKLDKTSPSLVDFFPDGSGWASSFTTFYRIENKELRPLPLANGFIPTRITLSPDGGGWLIGGESGIWEWGARPVALPPKRTALGATAIHRRGNFRGTAYFELKPGVPAIYLIDETTINLLVFPRKINTAVSADRYGLGEPQDSFDKRHNYDFATLAADFNGDGLDDIFLTSLYAQNCLFLNTGRGKFLDATRWSGISFRNGRYGIAATADVDNDGDLDLFVPDEIGSGVLYLNNGYGRFSDGTKQSGIAVPQGAKASVFGDIDNDGWIDLAVATYEEGSYLFRNLGDGRFVDATASSPVLRPATPEKCSSLAFADYDNDGDLDLYICKRSITSQLLQNNGRGQFVDVTQTAGLIDSSQSLGALFFDIDNDGDLDLFVGKMGRNAFYLNDGHGVFRLNNSLLQTASSTWLPDETAALQYGDISAGTITFDYENDGDLDFLVASYDGVSISINNHTDNDHFLELRLRGVISNPSAVGARATLYPAGKLGDSTAVLGARIVESVSGYGSHSQKLIHFGVDPAAKYDVEVVFPGGKRLLRHNLAAGKSYDITESSGWDGIRRVSLRFLENQILGYRGSLRILQIVTLLIVVIVAIATLRRYFWWNKALSAIGVAAIFGGLVIGHWLFIYQNNWGFFVWPLLWSIALGGLAIIFGWWQGFYNAPEASLAALSLKLTAFSHDASFTKQLSRLEMHLNNMPKNASTDAEFVERFAGISANVRENIGPEIRVIVGYQHAIRFELDAAIELQRTWRRLRKLLRKIENALQTQTNPTVGTIAQAQHDLQHLRDRLRKTRRTVAEHETIDIVAIIDSVVAEQKDSDLTIAWQPPVQAPTAPIPAAELRTILVELIANAGHAMPANSTKRVRIQVEAREQISIDITDNGPGIEQKNWQKIFNREFSTRPGGGFGLYYAKHLLARYGGDIFVKESTMGHGTTIRITLKKGATDEPSEKTQKDDSGHR